MFREHENRKVEWRCRARNRNLVPQNLNRVQRSRNRVQRNLRRKRSDPSASRDHQRGMVRPREAAAVKVKVRSRNEKRGGRYNRRPLRGSAIFFGRRRIDAALVSLAIS